MVKALDVSERTRPSCSQVCQKIWNGETCVITTQRAAESTMECKQKHFKYCAVLLLELTVSERILQACASSQLP